MERPDYTPYPGSEEERTYPEPDYVPAYPWLGQQVQGQRRRSPVYSIRDDGPIQDESFRPQNSGSEQGRLGSVSNEAMYRSTSLRSRLRHDDDSAFDPDFELSEGSRMSEIQLSGADSASLSESPSQSLQERPSRGNRKAKRGRTQGRGGRGRGARGGAAWKGIKRGPRKPAEPSQEFKVLHSKATTAFIDHNYDEADEFAQQAILANPEMFAAHSLLSEIHLARGDKGKALTALFNGAHTRPKDVQVWSRVANLILERAGDDRMAALNDAIYCYNRIIGVDPTNVHARYQRAALNRELGYNGRAVLEYERMLKLLPHDTTVLRHLTEVCIDIGEVERAKNHYDVSIAYCLSGEGASGTELSWSDINIYGELFGFLRRYAEGISRLKSLSRWFLGREREGYWDDIVEDDREWDSKDNPRRSQVEQFSSGQYGTMAYGDGLPLEIRIKLGIYRLKLGNHVKEALHHFDWLDAEDDRPGARLFDYPDLFREAADSLSDDGLYHEALRFYEPLQQVKDYTDVSFFAAMAKCYRAVGLISEAEDCYQTIIEHDEKNVDARVQLAKMFEELGMPEQAFTYATQVMLLGHQNMDSSKKGRVAASSAIAETESPMPTMLSHRTGRPGARKPKVNLSIAEKADLERTRNDTIRILHLRFLELREAMLAGNEDSTTQWLDVTRRLILDFKSNKIFFPWDRYIKFQGYSRDARNRPFKSRKSGPIDEMEAMTERLQNSLGDQEEVVVSETPSIPTDYRGISFEMWLDVFLEYAFHLARVGDIEGAYETITTATEASVFYHNRQFIYLIHVCWFTCALYNDDEEALCSISRWFMKEYQFSTDSYRLFSALNRLSNAPISWYNSGPSQKFILRQIKAMDFSLLGDGASGSIFHEKASYSTKDENGNPVPAQDMDVALLMLYGHILSTGTSYSHALNYFFRAFALDPTNPMINLSLALGYIHYALKRQSENRHHLIMQGLSFLFVYYDLRHSSASLQEKQEAEFNVARAYNMLGLTHLAIPYYQRCLDLGQDQYDSESKRFVDDFSRDAAMALQGIWAQGGNTEMARAITERWLIV